MIVAKINVTGANASVEWKAPITSGMIGAAVQIGYSEYWQELTKTVIFAGACKKDVTTNDTLVRIPKECLQSPGERMQVGVYGFPDDKIEATPTIWADIGIILPGANPSGDETTDDYLPVYAQILKTANNAENIAKKMAGSAATSAAESARAATEAQNAANRVLEDAAAGRFDGAPGADGHTPVKGVDYFTPSEVSEIEAGAAAKLEPELSKVKEDLVNKVDFSKPQSLTSQQQTQAQSNIGIYRITQDEYDALTDTRGIYIIMEE